MFARLHIHLTAAALWSLTARRSSTRCITFAAYALYSLWRRRQRLLSHRLLAAATEAPPASRPADSCCEWNLSELAALHYSKDYLFVYKQHDLHMDHARVPVTLATQLRAAFPHLADPKTAFGFRHVHQLDFATSGAPPQRPACSNAYTPYSQIRSPAQRQRAHLRQACSASRSISERRARRASSSRPAWSPSATSPWWRATPSGSTCASREASVGATDPAPLLQPCSLCYHPSPLLHSLTLAPILHPSYHPLRSCSCYGPLPGEDGTDARGFRMALEGAEGRRLPLQPLALTANHSPLLHPLARLHSAARRRHRLLRGRPRLPSREGGGQGAALSTEREAAPAPPALRVHGCAFPHSLPSHAPSLPLFFSISPPSLRLRPRSGGRRGIHRRPRLAPHDVCRVWLESQMRLAPPHSALQTCRSRGWAAYWCRLHAWMLRLPLKKQVRTSSPPTSPAAAPHLRQPLMKQACFSSLPPPHIPRPPTRMPRSPQCCVNSRLAAFLISAAISAHASPPPRQASCAPGVSSPSRVYLAPILSSRTGAHLHRLL